LVDVLGCSNGHRFDVAREGYINLLATNRRGSRTPGDSLDMLQARRTFLELGHYQPVANALIAMVGRLADPARPLVDLGCGEGWYTEQLATHRATSSTWGLDVAKQAVAMASRRPGVLGVVASARDLPFQPGSFGAAVSVFAPRWVEPFAAVADRDALFVGVGPGEQHLNELASLIYDDVRPHDTVAFDDESRVSRAATERITFSLDLSPETGLRELFLMTPYYWQTSAERQAQVMQLDALSVTIDIELVAARVY